MIIALLIVALVVVSALYLWGIGVKAPPQWSLYGYVALWLFVPKASRLTYLTGGRYDFPTGMTVFNVLEAIAAAGIAVALFVHRGEVSPGRRARWLQWLAVALAVVGVLALMESLNLFEPILPTSVERMSDYLATNSRAQYRVLPILSMIYAALLMFGCARFIRRVEQYEPFCWLFAALGIELTVERIVFINLNLVPSIHYLAVRAGRLNSIVFTDYDLVGVFSILTITSSLYLALRGRRIAWVAFVLAWIPLLSTYQRAPLLGAVGAVVFVLVALANRRQLRIALIAVAVLAAVLVIGGLGHNPLTQIGHTLGGKVRTDYFGTTDGIEREAYGKRAIDTFRYVFPAGVSDGVVDQAMGYPIPGAHADLSSHLASNLYHLLATRDIVTNPHDQYLELLVDFGVLAIPLIAAYIIVMFRLFAGRLRRDQVSSESERRLRLVQAVGVAALVGLGIHGLVNDLVMPYWIFVLPAVPLTIVQTPTQDESARRPLRQRLRERWTILQRPAIRA